jgi:hypothetical protein
MFYTMCVHTISNRVSRKEEEKREGGRRRSEEGRGLFGSEATMTRW